jgi:HD-like signal output (HDOD) protein
MTTSCPHCGDSLPQSLGAAPALAVCLACHNPVLLPVAGPGAGAQPLAGGSDYRQVAPPGSIGAALLEALPAAIERMPVLPEISQQVMLAVRNPDTSMGDIAALIREDQVIAMAVMRHANSAMYGGIQEITDLTAACARLGMSMVANIVQVVAANNLFISGHPQLRTLMQRLWRHSIATAHCAAVISRVVSEPRGESSFLAGLVHDVGKIAMLEIVSGAYSGPLGELRKSAPLLREYLESFHAIAGLHAVQAWKLPGEFLCTTYFHHAPEQCPVEDALARAHIVSLANVVAQIEGHGLFEAPDVVLAAHGSARYLGLTDIKLASLRVDLEDTLEALFQTADCAA